MKYRWFFVISAKGWVWFANNVSFTEEDRGMAELDALREEIEVLRRLPAETATVLHRASALTGTGRTFNLRMELN